jgi:hypothetical protein
MKAGFTIADRTLWAGSRRKDAQSGAAVMDRILGGSADPRRADA